VGSEPQVETPEAFEDRFGELFTGLSGDQFVIATARGSSDLFNLGNNLKGATAVFGEVPDGIRRLVVLTQDVVDDFIDQADGIEVHDLTAVAA
jgi:hypothetical protein